MMSLSVASSVGIIGRPTELPFVDGRRVYGTKTNILMKRAFKASTREILNANYCTSRYKPISLEMAREQGGYYGLMLDFNRDQDGHKRASLVTDSKDISDLFEEAKVDRKNPSGLIGRKVLSYECAYIGLGFSLNVPEDQKLRRYFY